jgi:hypothetical protein
LVAAVALTVMAATLFFARDLSILQLAEHSFDEAAVSRIALLMLLVAGVLGLSFFFIRHLGRIVDSVADGDPFLPVNADRLRSMGWLALAIQVLVIPATGLLVWFDAFPQKANVHYVDNNSFGGLVIAILLFVLARVFRVGAAMREELEGTV